jgi:hypothetical protein
MRDLSYSRCAKCLARRPGSLEVDVRIRTVQTACVAAAILLLSAIPSAAQSSLGVGLSFLGDEGGTGLILDYAAPYGSVGGDKPLSFVGDFSIFHNGFGNDFAGVGGGFTTLMIQGGVRVAGKAADKVTWHGQGLIGVRRASVSFDTGLDKEVCDALDIDCSIGASDTGLVLTIGGAAEYAISDTKAARAQLDFPINGDGSTTRFSLMFVLKMK